MSTAPTDLQTKLETLKGILRDMAGVVVAYSGGVDSTCLLRVAHEVLGDKVLAATACSETYPAHERAMAAEIVRRYGIRAVEVETSELAIEGFADNPPDRCYYCKTELFKTLQRVAAEHGIRWVADGSNCDDEGDFRPGRRAICELGIRSPLREAGLTKADIREVSREYDLPTWDKPAAACLSSRFPYGTRITEEAVRQVGAAEDLLRGLGFRQLRVRHHDGGIARIEVPPEDVGRFMLAEVREKVVEGLKQLEYTYVTLDLQGYRAGSMNEVLTAAQREASLKP